MSRATLTKVDQEMAFFKTQINSLDYNVDITIDLHGTVEKNDYCFSDEEHAKFNKMVATVR